jgi:hypothetical protein
MSLTFRIVAVAILGVAFVACSARVTRYVADERGRLHKMGTFTPEEIFKLDVEHEIGLELAGKKPPGLSKTWRHYWHNGYSFFPGSPDLDTHDKLVAYVLARRHARGLPPL